MDLSKLILAVAVMSTPTCGDALGVQGPDNRPFTKSDPYFGKFYDSFEHRFKAKIVDIPIRFSKKAFEGERSRWVAMCTKTRYGTRYITVNPKLWKTRNATGKQQVVDHELGHCYYNLKHNKDLLPNGSPKSIMFPTVFSDYSLDYYKSNNQYYVNEMKGK